MGFFYSLGVFATVSQLYFGLGSAVSICGSPQGGARVTSSRLTYSAAPRWIRPESCRATILSNAYTQLQMTFTLASHEDTSGACNARFALRFTGGAVVHVCPLQEHQKNIPFQTVLKPQQEVSVSLSNPNSEALKFDIQVATNASVVVTAVGGKVTAVGSVEEPPAAVYSGGLSAQAGAIAGVVVGVIIFVAAIVTGIIYWRCRVYKRQQRSTKKFRPPSQSDGASNSSPDSGFHGDKPPAQNAKSGRSNDFHHIVNGKAATVDRSHYMLRRDPIGGEPASYGTPYSEPPLSTTTSTMLQNSSLSPGRISIATVSSSQSGVFTQKVLSEYDRRQQQSSIQAQSLDIKDELARSNHHNGAYLDRCNDPDNVVEQCTNNVNRSGAMQPHLNSEGSTDNLIVGSQHNNKANHPALKPTSSTIAQDYQQPHVDENMPRQGPTASTLKVERVRVEYDNDDKPESQYPRTSSSRTSSYREENLKMGVSDLAPSLANRMQAPPPQRVETSPKMGLASKRRRRPYAESPNITLDSPSTSFSEAEIPANNSKSSNDAANSSKQRIRWSDLPPDEQPPHLYRNSQQLTGEPMPPLHLTSCISDAEHDVINEPPKLERVYESPRHYSNPAFANSDEAAPLNASRTRPDGKPQRPVLQPQRNQPEPAIMQSAPPSRKQNAATTEEKQCPPGHQVTRPLAQHESRGSSQPPPLQSWPSSQTQIIPPQRRSPLLAQPRRPSPKLHDSSYQHGNRYTDSALPLRNQARHVVPLSAVPHHALRGFVNHGQTLEEGDLTDTELRHIDSDASTVSSFDLNKEPVIRSHLPPISAIEDISIDSMDSQFSQSTVEEEGSMTSQPLDGSTTGSISTMNTVISNQSFPSQSTITSNRSNRSTNSSSNNLRTNRTNSTWQKSNSTGPVETAI